jgi:hypothetical protein
MGPLNPEEKKFTSKCGLRAPCTYSKTYIDFFMIIDPGKDIKAGLLSLCI